MTTTNDPQPPFTTVMQVALCVRDLDATIRNYEAIGIGPWTRWDTTPESFPDQHEHGRPVAHTTRCAATYIGSVMWEVFQPLSPDSIFSQFLEEKGEGVHHIGLRTTDFDTLIAGHTRDGATLPLHGHIDGIDVAYLPTERTLGVLLEVFKAPPGHPTERGVTGVNTTTPAAHRLG